MGVVADFIATAKTFVSTSNLARYLQAKLPIEPSTPAAFQATDEVQTIPQAESDDGTWTLTITLRNGVTFTTAAMAHDLNAAGIIAAIDTASPASVANGDIAVTGGPIDSDDVVLTFEDTVGGQNHGLSVVASSLTLSAEPVAAPTVLVTEAGQTERNGWAVLKALGVITDTSPPAQGSNTAPTAGANLLRVPPWVVREIAEEIAFTDLNNALYQTIVTAVVGVADSAPLVETARA